MARWRLGLKSDPTPWLLEPACPPIRYWALTDLLDRPADDPEVIAARRTILTYPPVAALLSAQSADGTWGRRDFYLPRAGRGTFWVLTMLADFGLTISDEPVRRACEFIFTCQRDDGAFCRLQHVPGQGEVLVSSTEPCTQARIIRFLIQFGCGADLRVRRAIDWLLPLQRPDGMWFCRGNTGCGCLRATLDVLRVAAIDPQTAAHPGIPGAVAAVTGLLMQPRMSRYHVGEAWGTWASLKYPYFGFSLLSALDALARLGTRLDPQASACPIEHPNLAAAVEYLLSRQLPNGAWPLDDAWPGAPLDPGKIGQPNQWITLDAMRVLKLLYSE